MMDKAKEFAFGIIAVLLMIAALAIVFHSCDAHAQVVGGSPANAYLGTDSSEKVNSHTVTSIGSGSTAPFKVVVTAGDGKRFARTGPNYGQYTVVTLAPANNETSTTLIEEMWVSAVSGDTLTIVARKNTNTSQTSWPIGSYIGIRMSFQQLKQMQDSLRRLRVRLDSALAQYDSFNGNWPDTANKRGYVLSMQDTGSFNGWALIPGSNGVTSIATTSPILGGTITGSGTISIQPSSATQAGYTSSSQVSYWNAKQAALPSFAGDSSFVLSNDGTNLLWRSGVATGTVTSVNVNGGTTGWVFLGGPIVNTGSLTLSGVGGIANGGTGGATKAQAFTNLAPDSTGHGGQVLYDNPAGGWGFLSVGGTGTVTSITGSGGTTGLTLTGGAITTSGTLTLGGTLAVANGGTGETTDSLAFNNLAPVQTGDSGMFLATNGHGALWKTVSGSSFTFPKPLQVDSGGTGDTTLASNGPLYGNGTGAVKALAVNATATNKFLTQSSSAAPAWNTIATGDVPTLNQSTTGSAGTLSPGRTINGVAFNGSTNITVAAAAGTLTGTTLASNVLSTSITGLGTVGSGTWQGTAIDNAYLSHSSVTVTAGTGLTGGGTVALGGTITLNSDSTRIADTAIKVNHALVLDSAGKVNHALVLDSAGKVNHALVLDSTKRSGTTAVADSSAKVNHLAVLDSTKRSGTTALADSAKVVSLLVVLDSAKKSATTHYGDTSGLAHKADTAAMQHVITLSGGTTGLTPNSATSGAVTLGGTLGVGHGGTGVDTLIPWAILIGDTTSTKPIVQMAGVGGAGQVVTSNGAGTAPTWQNIPSGFANPMTTNGDIIYENVTPTPVRLPIGSSTNLLTVSSGIPAWEAIPTWNQNTTGSAATVPASGITGTTLASGVVTSSLTSVGTIATGVWQGTAIANSYLANSTIGLTSGGSLTITGSAIALGGAGTINIALGHANTWTAAQTFATPVNINSASGVYQLNGQNFLRDYGQTGSVFVGTSAGNSLAPNYNTGVGYATLSSLTGGHDNVAIGSSACESDTSGSYNSALGSYALAGNTSGSYDIGLGYGAGYSSASNLSHVLLVGGNITTGNGVTKSYWGDGDMQADGYAPDNFEFHGTSNHTGTTSDTAKGSGTLSFYPGAPTLGAHTGVGLLNFYSYVAGAVRTTAPAPVVLSVTIDSDGIVNAQHFITTSTIGVATDSGVGVTSVSVVGSDVAGTITLSTTLSATPSWVKIPFGTTYGTAPVVVVGPGGSALLTGTTISAVDPYPTYFMITFSATAAQTAAQIPYIVVH